MYHSSLRYMGCVWVGLCCIQNEGDIQSVFHSNCELLEIGLGGGEQGVSGCYGYISGVCVRVLL